MRIIDVDRRQSVRSAQLYFSVREAREIISQLGRLLADPERREHFHVLDDGGTTREISCSIITRTKLDHGSYTPVERRVLDED